MKHRGVAEVKMGLRKLGREGTLWVMTDLRLSLFVCAFAVSVSVRGQPRDGCNSSCGNLTIPYPFGTKEGCYLNPGFFITCDDDSNTPFVMDSNIKLFNISLLGELRVEVERSFICYNRRGNLSRRHWIQAWTGSYFTLSSKRNKFTAVGCDTYAYLEGSQGTRYSTGCMSVCNSTQDIILSADGSCSGLGCCQTSIPRGVKDFNVSVYSFHNHTAVNGFNPCSYAFVVEDSYFNFSIQDLKDLRNVSAFPIIFDWSIGNQTCEQVGNTNVCSDNSNCEDSDNGPGYLCKCWNGYEGNPYLPKGCQDIDECARGIHNCAKPEFCHNKNGSFYCQCPKGYHGDATKGCNPKGLARKTILLGTTIGFLVFLLGLCGLNLELRRRKHIKLRERFFEQNGGLLLRSRLSTTWPSGDQDIKVFTADELKDVTNGYHQSRILGEGGQGTVYKGILPDNQEIAIKKARIGDLSQVEQFINELIVLSQINYKNVVKLLGCCLETEVPSLIYEFVNNGTLFDHLHRNMFQSLLPWETRLNIAIETAQTLSYLHSYASIPIIHRDVKSANILLDDKFTAKVSDFGASRLIPADKEQLSTLVQGTLGYLDPEYFHTSKLNEKSDVYSFGVVLMELLSGQKALCFDRPENARHLVTYFASALTEYRLDRVLDRRISNAENHEQLKDVARLAIRCTRVKGEERPTMKEVASELERFRVTEKHPWTDLYPEDVEHLLGDHILYVEGNSSNSDIVSGFDSTKKADEFPIKTGR